MSTGSVGDRVLDYINTLEMEGVTVKIGRDEGCHLCPLKARASRDLYNFGQGLAQEQLHISGRL